MELWQEIFCRLLGSETLQISFPLARDLEKCFELECYKALARIRTIIHDNSLDDEECFMKIEEIVCAFEAMGSTGGGRHDFS